MRPKVGDKVRYLIDISWDPDKTERGEVTAIELGFAGRYHFDVFWPGCCNGAGCTHQYFETEIGRIVEIDEHHDNSWAPEFEID